MADRYRDYERGEGRGEAWRERDERWRNERSRSESDRGLTERATDEVRSWFGDEEARRRREYDERRDASQEGWRDERDRPFDRDREREERFSRDPGAAYGREYGRTYGASRPTTSQYRGRDWDDLKGREFNRERDFGRTDRYANVDEGIGYGQRSARSVGTSGLAAASSSAVREDWRERQQSDWSTEYGPYSGRGPRGYQRSDDRIREDVCERLTRHGRIDASDMEVTVTNGEVTLTGSVNDRDSKRLAEDVAELVSGVRDVNNQIRYRRGSSETVGTFGRDRDSDRPRDAQTHPEDAGEMDDRGNVLGISEPKK